jgi:hypothetical protein
MRYAPLGEVIMQSRVRPGVNSQNIQHINPIGPNEVGSHLGADSHNVPVLGYRVTEAVPAELPTHLVLMR